MTPQPPLRPEQFDRYRRHLNLPHFGLEGQTRLLEASVLLLGAGGLGSPLAQYLAAAGVGRLGLVDDDVVDASNLQRQVLYTTADIGASKVAVAAARLRAMNPDVEVEEHPLRLDASNALELFRRYDVIVDGTDNFPTRYLSNDACVLLEKPNVHGAIFRFEGQATVFDAARGPCYRCLFPEPPPPGAVPSCAEGGVLGVLPGIVAMIQATETVKLLAGIGDSLVGRLLQYDALDMRFSEFQLQKDPACPACGDNPTLTELIDYQQFCGFGADEGQEIDEASAAEVARRRESGEAFLFLDVREPEEFERSKIEGTTLVPLGELPDRVNELAVWKDKPIVVHCKSGGRSAEACQILVAAGFSNVVNLSGGIEAWSLTVDPAVPRY